MGLERTRLVVDLTHCRFDDDPAQMRPLRGRVALSLLSPETDLLTGDRVRFLTNLHHPHAYRNPGGDPRFLRQRVEGIDAVGFIADPAWIVRIAAGERQRVPRTFDAWVRRVETSLGAVADGDALGVLQATITGNGSRISPEGWERFRRVGVIHLLVISGFQVACVGLFFWAVCGWVLRRSAWLVVRCPVWKWCAAGSLAAIWGYALFAGGNIPVVRAALMGSGVLLAVWCDRRRDVASVVALAAIILLCRSPYDLFLPSFQLTFGAVIGLLLWWPWLRRMGRHWWLDGLLATIAATIGVLPILAYHYHTVSQMGLVTNLLLAPFVGFVLTPLGLLFACVAPWWPAAVAWLGLPLRWSAEAILQCVAWADRMSAPWQVAFTPTVIECCGWYLAWCVPLVWRRDVWRRGLGVVAIGCVVWGVGGRLVPFVTTAQLAITVLDVGQGSAAVVRFPNRQVMMVDGGGIAGSPFDIGRWVVAPALHHQQIHRIDRLVLTHPHPDHYGGLAFLAEAFHPGTFVTNGAPADRDDPTWPLIDARIAATQVPRRAMQAGVPPIVEGAVTVTTLHPGPEGPLMVYGQNNNSLVQLIEYGAIRILLAGDIEREGEAQLLGRTAIGPVDLLLVPHHGSRTSSTAALIDQVRPRIAVISCGQQNRYGFPAPEVVQRLEAVGTTIYRTDRDGAVTIRTDGKTVWVETYVR